MTTSSPKDEASSYNLLLMSQTIFMMTLKGDCSKDIISNDCNYMADLKLQVPTAELVLTAALSRFLLVVHQRNDSPGVERNATVQGGIRENSPQLQGVSLETPFFKTLKEDLKYKIGPHFCYF